MVTRDGLRRWRSAIDAMRGAHVAANSAVCRVGGVAATMASMSSAKPMSSISSASSSTSTSSAPRSSVLATQVIERAARRGDDDVDAAAERADLLIHRRAAVERDDGEARSCGRTCAWPRRPASPARAWARGRGRARRAFSEAPASRQPVEDRQDEGGGLSGAGAGLTEPGRGPRAAGGWPRAESAWALRSPRAVTAVTSEGWSLSAPNPSASRVGG